MKRKFLQQKKVAIALTIAAVLMITGIVLVATSEERLDDPRVKVVATFYPLWFFSSEIGKDKANVRMLIPDNSEPHSWEPSPSDVLTVSSADIFIYNGAGFEPWIDDFISQISDPDVILVDTSEKISQITVEGGFEDPHFWLDPLSAITQVDNILAGYVAKDPTNASIYEQNAKDLGSRLMQLHQDFMTGLENRTKDTIITTHEGFDYLANRYGIEAFAAVGISADAQPSAQDLANLANMIDDLGLSYVYAEPIYSDDIIETIADETGAQVLILDGVHGRSGEHAGMDYFEIMYENLENLKIGLDVQVSG